VPRQESHRSGVTVFATHVTDLYPYHRPLELREAYELVSLRKIDITMEYFNIANIILNQVLSRLWPSTPRPA